MANLEELKSWHSNWQDLRVLVLGAGKTGFSVADTLQELGSEILLLAEQASDEVLDLLEVIGVSHLIKADANSMVSELERFAPNLLITSPGILPSNPVIARALKLGIPVWTDVDLAWRLKDKFSNKQEWICLTGTNGKTTTAELTEAMFQAAGIRAISCGNIGRPILDCIRDPAAFEVLIVELSSFQLHYLTEIEPFSSALLNIAEDHLDWHGSLEEYSRVKGKVYENTKKACVYNLEDSKTRVLLEQADVKEGARAIGFGLGIPGPSDVGFVEGILVDRAFLEERANNALEIAAAEDFEQLGLISPHLLSNIAAATALARSYGISPSTIRDAVRNFRVSAHRIELVGEIEGVKFVNDSKATNAHAASASLRAFENIVWIVGGLLKGVDISSLIEEFFPKLRGVVVIGKDRGAITEAFSNLAPELPVVEVEDSDFVMREAVKIAKSIAQPGDTVLLAPAAASMDQFTDYAQRGSEFAKATKELELGANG
jgi:UDP-N-acetylmuramoylalanine--D-glutamate ligase